VVHRLLLHALLALAVVPLLLKHQQLSLLPILIAPALPTNTETAAHAQIALLVLVARLDPLPLLLAIARLTSMEAAPRLELSHVLLALTMVPLLSKLQHQLPLSLLLAHAQTIPTEPKPILDVLPAPMQVPLLELLPLLLPPVPVVLAPTAVPWHALSALLDLGPLLDLLLLLTASAWLTTGEPVVLHALPV
jgi:hypothetical protein